MLSIREYGLMDREIGNNLYIYITITLNHAVESVTDGFRLRFDHEPPEGLGMILYCWLNNSGCYVTAQ